MPIASLFAVILAIALTAGPVRAHDWYPLDCCSGQDCAPVLNAQFDPDRGLVVTSRHGTIAVPASFPRRESKDNRMHVCIRYGTLRCFFEPPMM